jgi:hypothetical protein
MVILLAVGIRLSFTGSYPAEDVGFLRAKKIGCTPFFVWEVKPSVPYC